MFQKLKVFFNIGEHRENNTTGIPILKTVAEDEDPLGNIFNINTIPTLMESHGFTVASSILSFGVSAGLQTGVKQTQKAVNSVIRRELLKKGDDALLATTKASEAIQKAANVVNPFITTGIISTGESGIESMGAYRDALKDGINNIDNIKGELVNSEFQRLLENVKVDEDGNVSYNTERGIVTVPQEEYLKGLYKIAEETVDSQYGEQLTSLYDKAQKIAIGVGGNTMIWNQTVNGLINHTLKVGWQAPSVQKQIAQSRIGKGLFSPTIFKQSGKEIVANKQSVRSAVRSLKAASGEGLEEFEQEGGANVFKAVGENKLNKFIEHTFNPSIEYEDSFIENLSLGLKTAYGEFSNRNTLAAGVFGALSGGFGGVNINTNFQAGKRKQGESKWDAALRNSPVRWQSPMVDEIKSSIKEHQDNKETAKLINDLLQDPTRMSKFTGLTGSLNWANEMQEAANKNDEFAYRNGILGKTVNDILLLNKVEGTKIYDGVISELTKVANTVEGSKEATLLASTMKNAIHNKDVQMTDEEAVEVAKKNANSMLNTISEVKKESDVIDKILGSNINENSKQALIYGKLSIKDWDSRLSKIKEDLSKVNVPSQQGSSLNSEQKSIVVNFGSLNKAESKVKDVNNKIETLKGEIAEIQSRKNITGNKEKEAIQKKKDEIKVLKQSVNKLTEKIGESVTSDVLSADEIMALPIQERAKILNEKNKNLYSEEQIKIIDELVKEGTITDSEFINKIEDAARIKNARTEFLTEYQKALQDPTNLNVYSQKLKARTALAELKKSYLELGKIEDYNVFMSKVDDIMEEGDPVKVYYLKETLKDNPNFIKYNDNNEKLKQLLEKVYNYSVTNKLSDKDSDILLDVADYMHQNDIDSSDFDQLQQSFLEVDETTGNNKLVQYLEKLQSALPIEEQTPIDLNHILEQFKDLNIKYAENAKEVEKN